MVRRMKEVVDYEIPAGCYRGDIEYIEKICDKCGDEATVLYDIGDGEQLCESCLKEATRLA